jgi:hypothetical protein
VPSRTRTLRAGPPGAVLLGVDFSEGRQVAGFPELAPLLPDGLTLLECRSSVVEELADGELLPDRYARLVLDDLAAAGHRVTAVLGRCGGAGLACRLAEEAGAVPVVLFDPEVVDAGHVHRQFERVVRGLGLTPEPTRAHQDDLPGLLDELCARYAELVPPALANRGIPGELAGELVERFTVFARYLLCASRAPIQVRHGIVHEVLSRTHPTAGGTVLRVDADRAELLGSPAAARAVLDLVRQPA